MRLVTAGAVALMLMLLIPGGGSTYAQAACPDLSGRYVMQYEDGRVYVTIAQSRCEARVRHHRSGFIELDKPDLGHQEHVSLGGLLDVVKADARPERREPSAVVAKQPAVGANPQHAAAADAQASHVAFL